MVYTYTVATPIAKASCPIQNNYIEELLILLTLIIFNNF